MKHAAACILALMTKSPPTTTSAAFLHTLFVTILYSFTTWAPCNAMVYLVEKDGSGDFLEIQDAVQQAADGDTIRIGPGRWSRMVEHIAPAWQDSSVVVIEDKGLTLLGAGAESTFIGPDHLPPEFHPAGPFCVLFLADADLVIRGVTIENAGTALYVDGRSLTLVESVVAHARIGVSVWATTSIKVSDCRFMDCRDLGFTSWSTTDRIDIERCEFIAPLISTCFHTQIQRSPNFTLTLQNSRPQAAFRSPSMTRSSSSCTALL